MLDTKFSFEGLIINKIIAHRVYARNADKTIDPPKISNHLINLSNEAKTSLESRITNALGNKSHGIEMTIRETDDNSFFNIAANALFDSDSEFIIKTSMLAQNLSKAQLSVNTPGGILIIAKGHVGEDDKRFIIVIKAEPQSGFQTSDNDDNISLEYIKDLLLTDAQRLYKIGFLVEETNQSRTKLHVSNFRAFLFDHLLTSIDTKKAGSYFYYNFLGMSIAESSKKLTQNFFEFTKNFIDNSGMTDDEKIDTHEALRVMLKNQDAMISVHDFAKQNLSVEYQNQYEKFMEKKNFPSNSVIKDTEYIKKRLNTRRKYCFSNNVIISTPSNKTEEYLSLKELEDQKYTQITIKGLLQKQE
ncbi:nucleoid-associated protein [Snodgrassella alvi]|uniref:nucleoid-associated protein n=1 Tax=Snodgrassella alvi TaxID=1196083 RepID=UPI0035112915